MKNMASPAEPITQRSNHPAETMTHADRFILQSKAEVMNPDVAGATLSWLIGLGIISAGVSYLVALCGTNPVEKHVKEFRANVKSAIDEQ